MMTDRQTGCEEERKTVPLGNIGPVDLVSLGGLGEHLGWSLHVRPRVKPEMLLLYFRRSTWLAKEACRFSLELALTSRVHQHGNDPADLLHSIPVI